MGWNQHSRASRDQHGFNRWFTEAEMMWGLIRDTARLDIIDLNFSYSSERLGVSKHLTAGELPRKGVAVRIASFLLHLLWALVHPKRKQKAGPPRPVVFFATSLNQRESIYPVAKHVGDSLLVCTHVRPGLRHDCDQEYSLALAYLSSLPFLPLVLGRLWKARGYTRESFSFWFDEYWLSYGHYLSARLWLRRLAPRSVVTANDHTMTPRTFAFAARDEGIPTIYLQHGAGSTRNPPLIFDYALLDGRDSLEKFQAAGSAGTKVFLIGKPRADATRREVNTSAQVRRVGVCTNFVDPIPRVEELCGRLRQEFGMMEFSIRPHPRDQRGVWADLAGRYSMRLSDPRVESPFEFLKAMDAIIAGDSSIHIEAALMNTYPLFFDYPQNRRDTHDFQRAGLVEYVSDVEEICRRVGQLSRHKPDVRSRAKPFIATVDTPYDGRSGELGAGLILEISSGGEVEGEGWRRIDGAVLEAFELVEETQSEGG